MAYLVAVKTMARDVTHATYLMILLDSAFASCMAYIRTNKQEEEHIRTMYQYTAQRLN